jgi:hypothetical protein
MWPSLLKVQTEASDFAGVLLQLFMRKKCFSSTLVELKHFFGLEGALYNAPKTNAESCQSTSNPPTPFLLGS